ncbi:hypothetical protein FOA52_000454 [Chlamydomonas sp. UWO 241]|nr:hypothetical protein FOA52_000454 [Chlamydomonas sp. UWO 241]
MGGVDADLAFGAVTVIICAFALTQTFVSFLCVFGVGQLCVFVLQAPVAAIGMWCVPSKLRPLGVSLMTMAIHLFGDVPSPPLLGLLQSRLAEGKSPADAAQQWRLSWAHGYHGMLMAPQYQYSAMAMPYSSHPMQYSSHPHGHNSRVATSHSRGHLGRSASAASGFARHERAAHAAAHVATKSAGVSATSSSGGWAARRSNEDGGDGCAASTSGRASDAPPAGDDEPEPLQCGWGSLTVAILQSVVARLGEGDVKHVRRVCRHWRSVADANLESLTPSDLQARTLVARFPNLRALHLTHCANIRNRSLMIISGAGLKLHTLSLGDDSVAARPWVTNEGLACIAHMTSLTSLHLHDCNGVTNNGLLALAGLHRLSTLSLKGCRKLTSGAFEALQGHSGLTHLNLHGCRVTDKGLAPLVSLGLVSLQLGNTRVRDEGLSYLAQITTLRELHFDHENLTDVGVAQLSTLTQLESLALRDCAGVSGDSLSVLIPALTNLLSLDLYKNYTMDDSELSRCLDLLGAVTYLDLRGTPVTEDGLQQLTKLSCLQKLCLAPTNERLWSPYLCVVSNLTQLTSLSINNCTLISWAELEALRQLKLLRELDLSHDGERRREHGHHGGHNGGHNGHDGDHAAAAHCMRPEQSVNPTAINAMAAITSLTSIDLSRRAVHEEHLSALAEKLPRLHNLIIIGCPVLYTEIQSLQRRFPDLMIHRKPLHDVSCSSSEFGER